MVQLINGTSVAFTPSKNCLLTPLRLSTLVSVSYGPLKSLSSFVRSLNVQGNEQSRLKSQTLNQEGDYLCFWRHIFRSLVDSFRNYMSCQSCTESPLLAPYPQKPSEDSVDIASSLCSSFVHNLSRARKELVIPAQLLANLFCKPVVFNLFKCDQEVDFDL
jgi:hypothetical protein